VRNKWASAGGQAKGGEKKAPAAAPAKKEAPKKEEKPADDDMDLFGDEDEGDKVSLLLNSKSLKLILFRKPRRN